jgi:uncharacterized protein
MPGRRQKAGSMSGSAGASPRSGPVAIMDDVEISAFLLARRPHPPAIGASGLDGYLTGLIIGPRFIDPTHWVPLFAGDTALTAGEDAPEFRFIQSMVANYNRISSCLSDFPALYRPRFEKRSNGTWDGILWMSGFLGATVFAPRLWNPVIKGYPSTGGIIAPIRSIGDAPAADDTEMQAVAKAVVEIREYFMPRRVKDAKRR